jgi:hypothetical protein
MTHRTSLKSTENDILVRSSYVRRVSSDVVLIDTYEDDGKSINGLPPGLGAVLASGIATMVAGSTSRDLWKAR